MLVEPLVDDWTHTQKGQPGVVRESQEQYVITFYVAGASAPLNAIYYSDAGPRATPDVVVGSMLWSPGEDYVAFPDRPHAWENQHTLQRVAALRKKKIWNLEADHVHWVDNHRFVGDQNTKKMPGGIMQFDGEAGAAELLISPTGGIGYQIAAVSGKEVTVTEILNNVPAGKTTWEQFTPACFVLNMDSLKKKSVACPSAPASPAAQAK
jgi:hypothetical protein